ncbi:MAG TPA: hypothetical protein VMZ04_08340 [Anaerolineae bacterium]|nr:hypothetical protein [Anaerolineae bacterium]
MKPQRIFISYLLVLPVFLILSLVLIVSSWTIEKFQIKKMVPTGEKADTRIVKI